MVSRHIPVEEERELYIRFNFHCVECLSAVSPVASDYSERAHVEPYSESQCNKAENLTLLCARHHKEFDRHDMRDYVRYRVTQWDRSGRRISASELARFLGERESLMDSSPSVFLRQLWALYGACRFDLTALKHAMASEANAYRLAGDLHLALDFLRLAQRFDAEDTPDPIAQELAVRGASVQGALGNLTRGIRTIHDLNSSLRRAPLDKDRLYHQIVLVNQLDRLGRWDATLKHINSLDLDDHRSRPTSFEAAWLSLFEGIAVAALHPAQFRSSDFGSHMATIANSGDARSTAGAKTALGRACILAGDHATATELLEDALPLRPKFEDPLNRACHAGLMATARFGSFLDSGDSKQLAQSISVCAGAIEGLAALKDKHFLPSAWGMLGRLLAERGQHEESQIALSLAAHHRMGQRRWANKTFPESSPDRAYFSVPFSAPLEPRTADLAELFVRGQQLLDAMSDARQ